jgi:hypothetical protein
MSEEIDVPELNVSDWRPEAVAEQVERLEAAGARPALITTLRWQSAAERQQAAVDAADEQRTATLRGQGLKGANRSHAARLR